MPRGADRPSLWRPSLFALTWQVSAWAGWAMVAWAVVSLTLTMLRAMGPPLAMLVVVVVLSEQGLGLNLSNLSISRPVNGPHALPVGSLRCPLSHGGSVLFHKDVIIKIASHVWILHRNNNTGK